MRKKTCCICGVKMLKDRMSYVKKSNGYICNSCKAVKSYGYNYFKTIKPADASDKLARSIGFELETIEPSEHAILELVKRNYNATHDATCSIEFKTPIYMSKEQLVKDLYFIDKMLKDKDIIINSACGTHVRIGGVSSCDIVESQVKEAIYTLCTDPFFLWLFGRSTCSYASTDINERCCMINITNISKYNAIEYRLPRFRNAKRFASLLDFLLKLTDALCGNANIFDLCKEFKQDFIASHKGEFKRANFDFYSEKIADLDLVTDFDVWEYVDDYISCNLSVYEGLSELQESTTLTLEDLLYVFDKRERLDNIFDYLYVVDDCNILYTCYTWDSVQEWTIECFEEDIKRIYGSAVLEDCKPEVESLYEDIKDGLTYEEYIREYC